jgi:hypothetical protein
MDRGCGRKSFGHNLKYQPGIFLEEMRKTMETSVKVAGLRAEI